MQTPLILIIEDSPKTADTVALYLGKEGYRTSVTGDGEEGLRLARSLYPDLILLDLMLPNLGGEEICRQLRAEGTTPIIMLTARTTEEERVAGFKLGADDYVAKPFSPRELVLRVEAVLRRTQVQGVTGPGRLNFDGLDLDLTARRLHVDGCAVELTPTEFKLLEVFLRVPARVFSRGDLIVSVFGHDFDGEERTVDAHVKNLRRKIDREPGAPSRVRTVFGAGYQISRRDEAP
ncbi:MAG: DNA-binding response OmpR family regulator [Planctomycetota bacterium]|jgi:DNA-binding response OmpR family regulator